MDIKGYKYRQINILYVVVVILTTLIMMQVSACGKADNSGVKLTSEEEEYINELSTFKDNNKDVMRNYMYVYIKHTNSKINEEDLGFIEKHTDKDYFSNVVKYNFLDESLIDYDIEGKDKENEKISTGGYISVPLDCEIPEESGMNIMRYYYFFKNNTYASKVYDTYGYKKVIYFRVEDNKVVEIYEL